MHHQNLKMLSFVHIFIFTFDCVLSFFFSGLPGDIGTISGNGKRYFEWRVHVNV